MFTQSPLAHRQAATLPAIPVLHRDISGGNILIVPRVYENNKGAFVAWLGLLTDWEMSKPISYETSGWARQPERTVCTA